MRIFKISTRDQFAQVQVSRPVLHQHRHAAGVIPIVLVADPKIAADDRLHTALARGRIKAHCSEQIRAVGKRQSALAIAGRLVHCVVDADDAVDDREFRMQAEMDKRRAAH